MSFSTTRVSAAQFQTTSQKHGGEEIRRPPAVIPRVTLFWSPPAPPAKWPCYERSPRCRPVPLKPGDVFPRAHQDGHSRCRVAELRAESHSDAWGTLLSLRA